MIKLGLIGTGYWGPNVARSMVETGGADLVCLCDRDAATLEVIGERYPDSRRTTDAADVFGDPTIEAGAISTPTRTHYAMVKAALEHDKHVLVEKPITVDVGEAEELVELAESRGLILMVGHVFQYNNTVIALREMISRGELGEVNYINLERTNLGPVRTDVNALWDLVSHDAYIMADLLGEMPESVSAIGQSFLNAGIADVVFGTFVFRSGAVAHVHASWLNPRKVRQITVVGTEKMAVWDDLDMAEPVRLFDKRIEQPQPGALEGSFLEHKTLVVDGGTSTPTVELNQPLKTECEHFLECVKTGARPLSDGRSGLDVVRALIAAEESMRNGGRLTPIV